MDKKTRIILWVVASVVVVMLVALSGYIVVRDQAYQQVSSAAAEEFAIPTENMDSLINFGGMGQNPMSKNLSMQERLGEGGFAQAFYEFRDLYNQVVLSDEFKECNYSIAIAAMDAEMYSQALPVFESLDGYKESQSYINECNEALYYSEFAQQLKNANVGDLVAFGTYEQDNNFQNGSEEIIWKVIGREGSRLLVISLYGLDCQRYHQTYAPITWENCTLRQWLNESFFNTAFNQQEQAMIPTVTVTPDRNQVYYTDSGNATEDKLFLLSISETLRYMPYGEQRLCWPTEYAVAQGAWVSTEGECWWWLRTPGDTQADAAGVFAGLGGIHEGGNDVDNDENAIRPAMWIELEP